MLAPAFAIDKIPVAAQIVTLTYPVLFIGETALLFLEQPCTWASVLEFEVLVSKLLPIDRLASSTVSAGEVTTLHQYHTENVKEREEDNQELTKLCPSVDTGT